MITVHRLQPYFSLKLSDRLGNDNLKAMKNLCYDLIPGRQRDEMDSGIVLFNILIEQSKQFLFRSAQKMATWIGTVRMPSLVFK